MAVESNLPLQAAFYHAVLRHLAGFPEGKARRDIYEGVADLLGLSDSQRAERLANMSVHRYRHRTGWALSMLQTAGYVENPAPGIWQIADRGRALLARYPEGFDDRTARQVIHDVPGAFRADGQSDNTAPDVTDDAAQETPDERIDAALEQIRSAVAQRLLERIAQSPPAFFERLVLDLLHAMGYGAREDDLELTGQPGDGGIDGIISLDKLGFEKVYVQAKRWQGSVGRPEVQAFYGALAGRRATKGVFITTSGFSREARDFANHVAESVVLIDGQRLASLMIEHGVGVTHYRILHLPRVDDDYFDSDEVVG